MSLILAENPTREKIIFLLKKKGGMSIEELSKELNITTMGVRQHLLVLERKGVIDYITKKHGIGRPGFLYRLTDKADEFFPKAYHRFTIDVLKDIEKNDGRNKIDEIFRWRKERLLRERMEVLSEKAGLCEKVSAMAKIIESDGYLVELEETQKDFRLKQFNCPISKIASEFKEACKYELQLYKDLLGGEVVRQQCLSEGAQSCTYVIPKAAEIN